MTYLRRLARAAATDGAWRRREFWRGALGGMLFRWSADLLGAPLVHRMVVARLIEEGHAQVRKPVFEPDESTVWH